MAGTAVEVKSGGSAPAAAVHASVVASLAEVGIDLASSVPQRWDERDLARADVVVTMGCGDECPVLPAVRYLDWPIEDPAGLSSDEVRSIREQIRAHVEALLTELGVEAALTEERP